MAYADFIIKTNITKVKEHKYDVIKKFVFFNQRLKYFKFYGNEEES